MSTETKVSETLQKSIKRFCKGKNKEREVNYLLVHTGYDERAYDSEHAEWKNAFEFQVEELADCSGEENPIELVPCKYGALFKVPSEHDAWTIIRSLYMDKTYCCIFQITETDYDPVHKLLMVRFDAESG